MDNLKYFSDIIDNFKNEAFNIKNALFIMHKLRVNYRITNNYEILKKAIEFVDYCYSKNDLDAKILLYKIYFNMYSDDYDEIAAKKMLKRVSKGIKYYKANDLELYFVINYVMAKFSNKKQFTKYLKIFEEYKNEHNICNVYIGNLLLQRDFSECFIFLKTAKNNGSKSVLLYQGFYRYFSLNECSKVDANILFSVLKWALKNNFDITNLVLKNIKLICSNVGRDIEFSDVLYNRVQDDEILKSICKYYIEKNEYSKKAFSYYRIAMKKQIEIANLNKFFINASYYNNNDNISNFYMSNYLKENSIDGHLESFIYFCLISNDHLHDLIKLYIENIDNYVKKIVDNVMFSERELNIFKYVLLNGYKFTLSEEQFERVKTIVFINLFAFKIRITNPEIDYVIVTDQYKATVVKYPVINNEVIVTNSSSEFSFYVYNKAKEEISNDFAVATPLIMSLDMDTYFYFYTIGYYSDELYIFLTNFCFEQNANDRDLFKILEKTNEISRLSDNFRKKINTYLAQLHILENDYDSALKSFDFIDYESISSAFLEKIIFAYISAKKYDLLYKIVSQNFNKINQNIILKIVKELDEKNKVLFSNVFINSLKLEYNEVLFKLAVEYSDLTFDLQRTYLTKARSIGYKNLKFFEKIIINSLSKRVIDDEIEKAFYDVLSNNNYHHKLNDYLELLLSKILSDEYRINDKTISLLETVRNNNDIANYILFINYDNYGTDKLEVFYEVLNVLERNNISFVTNNKMEKYYSDKAFFRKFKPVSYKTKPNRKVYLYYKIDNNYFESMEMKYLSYSYYHQKIQLFFGETVEYYFKEELENGSIESARYYYTQKNDFINKNTDDEFEILNNTLILKSKYLMNDCEKNIELLLNTENISLEYLN